MRTKQLTVYKQEILNDTERDCTKKLDQASEHNSQNVLSAQPENQYLQNDTDIEVSIDNQIIGMCGPAGCNSEFTGLLGSFKEIITEYYSDSDE